MPLYEYECEACGYRFEVIQRFSDPPVGACQRCDGPVHKLLSPPAIQFKGSGWYVTDYARKGSAEPATPASGAGGETGSGTDKAKPAAGGTAGSSPSPSSSSSS